MPARPPANRQPADSRSQLSEEPSFRTLAESVPLLVWTCGAAGDCDYLNGRWLEYTGRTLEESCGAGWIDAVHPGDRERWGSPWGKAGPSQLVYESEYRLRRADGVYRWFLAKAEPVLDDAGRVLGWFGNCADITDRKLAEEAVVRLNAELERQLREFQIILDFVPVGINIADDPMCMVIRSNLALAEMLGMAPGENVSKSGPDAATLPYRILKDGHDVPAGILPMQRAASVGVRVVDELYDLIRGDGSRMKILVRAHPITDAAGRVKGAVGICVDVTALKMAEEALQQADRRKDEFLAMLAHELRNPLASMSNALAILQAPDVAEADQQWASKMADRQLKMLGRLVDDLLDVSRISLGKLHLKHERLDAASIVTRVVDSVRPLLEERRHELTVALAPGAMPLLGDPTRLEQILANLLSNAAKYTDEGGKIELSAKRQGDEVVFQVRDNGIGIAGELLSKIFEMFTQVDASVDRSRGGLGIGLTLVRSLTQMHGGSVSAASAGPGKGSAFTVRLPVRTELPRASEDEEPGGENSRPVASRSISCRILVVDNDPDVLQSTERLLKLSGHETFTAHDGPSALEAARQHLPRVVLLDLGLPGMDGFAVAQALRRQQGMENALLVAVTGFSREGYRGKSLLAGFDDYLVKPVDLEALNSLIESTFGPPGSP